MNNEKILTMIANNQITELKNLQIEEISLTKSNNKNITKSIIKLSKLAEKEQRNGKDSNGNFYYYRPLLAGAWVNKDNKQCICNGYWGAIYNNITQDTKNVIEYEDKTLYFDLDKVFEINAQEKANITKVGINLQDITNQYKIAKATTEKQEIPLSIKIGTKYFNAESIINLLNSFDDYECFLCKNCLHINSKNGKGIILSYAQKDTATETYEKSKCYTITIEGESN